MFNDRDLGIIGAGALAAVLCLFMPFSFVGKVVIGFLVLILFMVAALLRLGPDRVPLEVWLRRKMRFAFGIRKYVNQQEPSRPEKKQERQATSRPAENLTAGNIRPLDLAWNEVGIYPLLSVFLTVLAVYLAFWLSRGGAQQISIYFRW